MRDQTMPTAAPHPEEMRAEMELRVGSSTVLRTSARATPAGLIAAGILVSAVLLSTAALVRAARDRSR
ncbi:hypothetical protein [Roseomonas populi]|uniref:Uncharacterized protein n=1 Tax=Roseomonas populi TaxID=3121582 RepID=A0ABT1X095_9PROT|nr:hypothetical protein [Roseomonas pecuniae]MCR0980597.1 hypothetical protein [Roseomonas pecuniae]